MRTPTNQEVNEALIELINRGTVIAIRQDGDIKFIHIEHTDDEMVNDSVPIEEVEEYLRQYTI